MDPRPVRRLTGEPVEYGKRLIGLDEFPQAVRGFIAEGGKGCNITVPFKFQAASLVTGRSERAALAEACNILSFEGDAIVGDNTDGIGLVADLERNAGVRLAGRELLLIGAGGAGRRAGPADRGRSAPHRGRQPQRRQGAGTGGAARGALAATHGVSLQATGLDVVPGPLRRGHQRHRQQPERRRRAGRRGRAQAGALACDMMYGPAAAGFLQWAREHGAVGRDGLGMLVEQAAEAFLIWRGVRPPSAQVLAELRQELQR